VNDTTRPDPDTLLRQIKADPDQNGRGRLKIFFGASAGVGKTYSMLNEARRLLAEGRDVLIGVIEHHGRTETAALVEGLPALPLKEINHRGVTIREFDLDAALARRPALILMDELAHTNAPGSLHAKRWQDVEALLDAGIDVLSTLNVQHLESVNDLVAKLTGIWVQETLPDSVFDKADEVTLVDLPTDDLLQRLAHGKVYVAEGAGARAAENFFKKGNLTALRELALRRTAERVDAEGDELSAALGHVDAPVRMKILALVGPDALSQKLIRHARRMAVSTKAPWTILPALGAPDALNAQTREKLERNLALAEKLGATIDRESRPLSAADFLSYARRNGFSRLVVGQPKQSLPLRWFVPSLARSLCDQGAGLEIVVLGEDKGASAREARPDDARRAPARIMPYLAAMGAVILCTLIGLPFRDLTAADNLTMIYLVGVVAVASRLGIGPALLTSVLGLAAFNFVFTQPYWSFSVYDERYYFTFSFMLAASLLVGSMAARQARHARLARESEQNTALLYSLTRALSAVREVPAICDSARSRLEPATACSIAFFLPGESGLAAYPPESGEDVKERSVAQWVLDNRRMAGRLTDTMPSARGLYLPLTAGSETLGAMAFTPREGAPSLPASDILRFETYADLVANALQRAFRAKEAAHSQVEAANEKLRNVLLASVSHDLRTPLTVMNGSVSTLLKMRKTLPRAAVDELTSLWGQLTRMQKFVANLLRMAAITSGQMALNRQPYLIQEIIGAAIGQSEARRGKRTIATRVDGHLPLVMLDGALIEQVLVNLIENAINHTAEDGHVMLSVERDADVLRLRVSDDGPGLPAGQEETIFSLFHAGSIERKDRGGEGGTGLGLAICRGIVNAHGGMIYAKNNPDRPGASFIFTLPLNASETHG